jgi:sugar lactone lactonase YvrE
MRLALGIVVGMMAFTAAGSAAAPRQAAPLREPYAVSAGPGGTLLVADGRSGRIVQVDPRTGRRVNFARGLGWVYDVARGPGGVYVGTSTRVWRLAHGRREVMARGLRDATGVAVAADGTLFVVESGRNRVLRVDARTHRRTVVASTGLDQPLGLALQADGTPLVADSHHGRVVRVGAGGRLEPVLQGLALPIGVTAVAGGGVVVVDHVAHDAFSRILLLRPDGTTETLSEGRIRAATSIAVARGGTRYVTSFARPFLGRLDASGGLQPLGKQAQSLDLAPRLVGRRPAFVGERWPVRIVYRGAPKTMTLVASKASRHVTAPLRRSGSTWTGSLRFGAQGRWKLALRSGSRTRSLGAVAVGYHVRAPVKLDAEGGGTLLVADAGTERILRLDPRTGLALAVSSKMPRLEVAAGPSGILALADEKLWRLEGSKPVLVTAFATEGPTDLAPRADGGVYVSRYGARVDLVAPDGTVRPFAGGFDRPHGITLASDGSLLVADSYAGAVRRISVDGAVATLATALAGPTDVVPLEDGNLLVAEHDSGTISRIGAGRVSPVTTRLSGPSGLAVTPSGSLFAADVDGGAVFAVDQGTGRVTRVSR